MTDRGRLAVTCGRFVFSYPGRPTWSQVVCCIAVISLLLSGLVVPGSAQFRQRQPGVVVGNPGAVAITDSGRAVPRQGYLLAFHPFYQGEYRDALRAFRAATNSGINTGAGRWVDSICYYTMIGECMFHMGDLPGALAQYDAALELAIARSGWLKRIQLTAAQPNSQVARIPWGPSKRNNNPGLFPSTMLSQQGTDLNRVLRQGGTVAPPQLVQVRVVEIMRCLALAIKRRGDILGPIAPTRPLTGKIIRELSKRQVVQNHWLQTLADVQLGLAQSAAGDRDAAMTQLQRSLSISGRFDHPLTALALLELGDLALAEGELDAAMGSYFEATFPAAYFQQADVLEEAFRKASRLHALQGDSPTFSPLLTATQLARSQNWDRFVVAALQSASHSAAVFGDVKQARSLLNEASKAMGRSDLPRGDLGARQQFLNAMLMLANGELEVGQRLFAESLRALTPHARRMIQIQMAQQLLNAKEISPRIAGNLFAQLLREPTPEDWRQRTDQTLLYETSEHAEALQRWLDVALENGQVETILRVGEQIKRHRFYQTQPMGGRLMALRWVMEAPEVLLGQADRVQRKALLDRMPKWTQWAQRMDELKAELTRLPVVPESANEIGLYKRVTGEIQQIAEQQESALWQLALQPLPASRLFPPLLDLDEVQSRLQPGQAILAMVNSSGGTHAVLISQNRQYKHWKLEGSRRVLAKTASLMRSIGNYDAQRVLPAEQLTQTHWQRGAENLFEPFTQELSGTVLEELRELVIVPDGVYWHVPFEMLHVQHGGKSQALIDLVPMRYAPTVGLAVPDQRPIRTAGPRLIVHGRLFSRDAAATTAEAADALRQQHPQSVVLRRTLPATSRFVGPSWNQLVVLDDIEWDEQSPLEWAPAQIDANQPGGALRDWLKLPWGGPDVVVLPGFHTMAETQMRGKSRGEEMFLSTCSLMGAGAKVVVLSRWRTGGRMSMELVQEYLEGITQQGSAAAWQRSVQLARSAQLDPASEPRLKNAQPDEVPTADHPFFWGGFLVVGH